MKYVSTRGNAPVLEFNDVLLAGLARDGGLYVPQEWPVLDAGTIAGFSGKPYAQVAKAVLRPFVEGQIAESDFSKMVDAAYETFRHEAVAPLVQVAPNHFVLELFHGPTMAFKDVAMQLLARLMDHVLAERNERATIIGATSGDTGGAAIEAFRGRDNTDIFILFPDGKVSDVQRMQMTTVNDANVHPLAVDGNFDDCQALVKSLFNDLNFRDEVRLSGVNSINWARIMAQIVYYFTSAVALGAPARKVSFTVPTGNFGDIFAGFVASKMGLPVERLVIATNQNDILTRCLETARYETGPVFATTSPSMDIQVSSNFERLLFEAHERSGDAVRRMMSGLSQSGSFSIEKEAFGRIEADFSAGRCDEAATASEIRDTLERSGYLLDPHSAVGLHVARQQARQGTPMVTLSTAHPAKFPDAVKAACGVVPALPAWQGDLMSRKERFSRIANDAEKLKAFIRQNARHG
ncbi:MAG: threonine synthase [Nitratireductor sp.]|nr:threonine synthase [Nitratireductor sp.]MCC0020581.1 threonine synthase [Nitratireductor sp.]